MRIYKQTFSKPLPEEAKILRRKSGKFAKYKDKKGRSKEARLTKSGDKILCETSHWHIKFEDNLSIRRELKAYTNEQATQRLADRIQQLLNCKSNNQPLDSELQKFVEQLSVKIRDELIRFGLLDSQQAKAGKPLGELVIEFEQNLIAKERNGKYRSDCIRQLRRIITECSFEFWSDISPTKVMTYLKGLRDAGLGYSRSNSYLKKLKAFCKWMVECGYVSQSPVQHLKTLDAKLDRRHVRRVLEPDELRQLLETTAAGPERFGLTGYERSLLYRFAAETGLRVNEIRSLTVRSFDFGKSTVTVEAGYSKRRRLDVLPLRKNTAAELKSYLANKLPAARAFAGTYKKLAKYTAEMMQADLKDAEIDYQDENGRFFDFHSLRHQTGSLLAASGTHPKVAQSLMRHSDINLTMSLYSHTLQGQESEAVESLPDLTLPSKEKQKSLKTGTDDKGVTEEILLKSCVSGDSIRRNTKLCEKKNPFVVQKQLLKANNEGVKNTDKVQQAGFAKCPVSAAVDISSIAQQQCLQQAPA